ncbi:MAG: glycosyltransferase family 2 protein [Chitinophagales bacterium]|nr:glycosyltransferase family 2 protein [Chitinophagales bacterium]
MKVTGFSIIRNAVKYDYPIVEAIRSILPLCDEFVIGIGQSEDDTIGLIESINSPKIKIIHTVWDDNLRTGGLVLSDETNKAFKAIEADTDWCFYIQGDEVIHEKYHDAIRAGMQEHLQDKRVDGLLFKYLHFYGSYDYVGSSTRWYPHEIRIIRNDKSIYSYKDAQGFRKGDDQKLNVKLLDAYVYHYGWVKDPRAMQRKQENFHKMWHDDEWLESNVIKAEAFDYFGDIDELAKFKGTHPAVMQERINRINWQFDYDISYNKRSLKTKFKTFAEEVLGIGMSYKNYKLI